MTGPSLSPIGANTKKPLHVISGEKAQSTKAKKTKLNKPKESFQLNKNDTTSLGLSGAQSPTVKHFSKRQTKWPANRSKEWEDKQETRVKSIRVKGKSCEKSDVKPKSWVKHTVYDSKPKELVYIRSDSLIALCAPFTIPNDTDERSYILVENRFSNLNNYIFNDLSPIYGSLTSKIKLNTTTVSNLSRQKHLRNLRYSLTLLSDDTTEPTTESALDLKNTDNVLTNLDLVSDSDSEVDMDLDSECDTERTVFLSTSTNPTFISQTFYEKTIMDIENLLNDGEVTINPC